MTGHIPPMLATGGSVSKLQPDRWAFEGKWDGHRMIVRAGGGDLQLWSRNGRDVTELYPQLHYLRDELAQYPATLDGEVVALDGLGLPSFDKLRNATDATHLEFWVFDILSLYGKSVCRAKYRDRRKLLRTMADAGMIHMPDLLQGSGQEALEYSQATGMEGVVAKDLDSPYRPGVRTATWIKEKHCRMQEVVIGGYTEGSGARSSTIGALLMGIPTPAGLKYAGRVGSGFRQRELETLRKSLDTIRIDQSPFTSDITKDVPSPIFVSPVLVGEVVYLERTLHGKLREPSWRGLRLDKSAQEVVKEL